MKRKLPTLSPQEARALVEAYEIDMLIENEEEAYLLLQNNPDLYRVYLKIVDIAQGDII
jgi:hypothetical protein